MQKIPAMDYVSRTEFMLTTVRRMTFDWTVEIRARFAPKNGRECHGFTAIPKYFTKSTVKRDSYFSLSHRIIFFLLYCGNKYYRFELVTSEGQRKSNFVKWKKKKWRKIIYWILESHSLTLGKAILHRFSVEQFVSIPNWIRSFLLVAAEKVNGKPHHIVYFLIVVHLFSGPMCFDCHICFSFFFSVVR